MSKTQAIVAAAVAVALVVAYVVVTVTGHDGTGLLGALVGWLAGGASQPLVQKATGAGQ